MQTPHFCAYQAERIKACGAVALRCWAETMRRGVQAYTACRMETAQIYLGSALDIGLLRYSCRDNLTFNDFHLSKPAEFLLELHLVNDEYGLAIAQLSKISSVIYDGEQQPSRQLLDQMAKLYTRVELCEREYKQVTRHHTKQPLVADRQQYH